MLTRVFAEKGLFCLQSRRHKCILTLQHNGTNNEGKPNVNTAFHAASLRSYLDSVVSTRCCIEDGRHSSINTSTKCHATHDKPTSLPADFMSALSLLHSSTSSDTFHVCSADLQNFTFEILLQAQRRRQFTRDSRPKHREFISRHTLSYQPSFTFIKEV